MHACHRWGFSVFGNGAAKEQTHTVIRGGGRDTKTQTHTYTDTDTQTHRHTHTDLLGDAGVDVCIAGTADSDRPPVFAFARRVVTWRSPARRSASCCRADAEGGGEGQWGARVTSSGSQVARTHARGNPAASSLRLVTPPNLLRQAAPGFPRPTSSRAPRPPSPAPPPT